MKPRLVLLFSVALLVACAPQGERQVIDSLNAGLEQMTFRQAVSAWGPPARISVVEGQQVFVATWVTKEESGTRYVPASGRHALAMTIEHGCEMNLTFRKTTGILVDWSQQDG
jgi:hypothetical protein